MHTGVLATRDGKARAMACVLFAGGVVLLHAGGYASSDASVPWARTQYGFPSQILVVTLALVCLGVALRFQAPLIALGIGTAAFIGDVVMGASLATILIYTDNIYAACAYGPRSMWRLMLMVTTTVSLAMGGVVYVAQQQQLGGSVVLTVVVAIVLVTPVVTAAVVRQQHDRAADERMRADRLARLSELERRNAVAAERGRMARELHDAVANRFSVIVVQSSALLRRDDLDAQTRTRLLTRIHDDGRQGLEELRMMIDVLRRETGEDGGDEPSVTAFGGAEDIGSLARSYGADVDLEVSGTVRPLSAAAGHAAYRITQEAITNALKHCGGPVRVRIAYREEEVELSIENTLCGGARPGPPGGGFGVPGMRERAEFLGGRITVGPAGHGVWRVCAVLPAPVGAGR